MRLLIVDDEPPVLKVLSGMLEPVVEEIVTMESSRKALDCVNQRPFDAMIFDVHMPAPDGFELTRRARASALNCRSAIALLTGNDDVRTMLEGFKAGASCFLGKPVTREKLLSLINFLRGPMMVETWRSVRLPYRCKVNCYPIESPEQQFAAVSVNLGEGGMLLEPSRGLKVNQQAILNFEVPSSERQLRIRARVLRCEPPDQIALQFLDNSVQDRQTIQEFILQKLREYGGCDQPGKKADALSRW